MSKSNGRAVKIGKLAYLLGCSESCIYKALNGKYGFGYDKAKFLGKHIGEDTDFWKKPGSKEEKRKLFDEAEI